MTITSFKEMHRGLIKKRPNGTLHGTIEYLATSDTVSENQVNIFGHATCPDQHVDAHPDNSDLICRELEVDEYEGNDFKWVVTATFDSQIDAQNIEYNFDNNIVEGGMRGVTEEVPTFWDVNGDPLANDADDYYEGLTEPKRLIVVSVTAYFDSVPWALFTRLSGTVNNAAITIHGVSIPAGLALLEEPDMPRRPIKTSSGTLLWPVSYRITIDAQGWVSILPNRGPHHYRYQTRTTTSDPWEDTGYDAYTAESNGDLKQRLKEVCTDDADADMPENVWLNDHGEAVLSPLGGISTTCNTTAGSTAITGIGIALTAEDVGKFVVIAGAGHEGKPLRAKIISQTGSAAVISPAAKTTTSAASMKGGGVYCKVFQIKDLADWTGLPLPNNHT